MSALAPLRPQPTEVDIGPSRSNALAYSPTLQSYTPAMSALAPLQPQPTEVDIGPSRSNAVAQSPAPLTPVATLEITPLIKPRVKPAGIRLPSTRYSLFTYLETVCLPSPIPNLCIACALPPSTWVPMRDRQRTPPHYRALRSVQLFSKLQFAIASKSYFNSIPQIWLDLTSEEDTNHLRLPGWDIIDLEEEDKRWLGNFDLSSRDQFAALLENYLFRTVSEVVRVMESLHPTARMCETTKLRRTDEFTDWLIATSMEWILYTLPPNAFEKCPLVVIAMPPWALNSQQFEYCLSSNEFQLGDVDTLVASDDPDHVLVKVWAAIYDECSKRDCKRFVVTNYLCWSFGTFNEDYSLAAITPSMEAPMLHLDNSRTQPKVLGSNIVQYLIYWMQRARGSAEEKPIPAGAAGKEADHLTFVHPDKQVTLQEFPKARPAITI